MGNSFVQPGKWVYNRGSSAAAVKATCGYLGKESIESPQERLHKRG